MKAAFEIIGTFGRGVGKVMASRPSILIQIKYGSI